MTLIAIRALALTLALLSAVAHTQTQTPAAQAGAAPQAPGLTFKQLAEDTRLKTPSGATFTVASGWHVAQSPTLIVIQEPDRELAAAFVEMTAPTVEEAIAAAWKRWKPDFARAVRQTAKPPVSQGWDEVAQIAYETGAEERRVVAGVARRKGTTYYVTLIDGAIGAAERRGAQLNIALGSLEVADRAEENLAGRKAHGLDAARAERFMAFAEQARKLAKVPGAAIAVVQNGKIVLERGLGVRELNTSEPVTPATLFMIGSMTKPLTSLMMARLVDRGTFAWDTAVTALLPSFALGDPDATRRVTMSHTVCACTGLPRWDMEFIFEWDGSTPEKRIELLRAMKPTTGFGETFQYSNLMVATGGYVAAMAATKGKDLRRGYADTMTAEVLRPLGMTATALDLDVARTREHARPHGRTLMFEPQPIATETERGVDSVMPAGGAWSNVRDLSRWLLLELNAGTLDGKRIVTEQNLLARRKPQVRINAKQSYGLALFLDESRGLTAMGHGGNTFGFTADATFFPEHGLGLVVLTNAASANAYTSAVRRRLVELLFDADEEAEKALAFGLKQTEEAITRQMQEITLTPDAAFIDPVMGRWTNPRLGTIEIRRDKDGVVFDAGEWRAPVGEHKDKSGARRILLTGPPFAGLAFWPQVNEGKPGLLFETAQQKYWFERAAQGPAKIDFARDVQPILRAHCVECHGPSQQMRGLRLDRRRDAMPNRVGANGARIVPGNSSASPVYRRLSADAGAQMPPQAPLSQGQIAVIKAWIDQGAEWPDALSGDIVTTQPDPAVVRMMHALRNGNRQEFNRALKENPKSVNGRGEAGWTPIMYAALYGDADVVAFLLAHGANPNTPNDGGGTALMYAVEDADKVRRLIEAGADVNARSGEGRTALLIAVSQHGATAVVKLLLDAQADPSVRLADGRGALALAVAARDASLLRLLLDRGAGKTPLPLANALASGCSACFDMLLELAAPADLTGALTAAVRIGDTSLITMLLDRGARPGPNILQAVALSPKTMPRDTIQVLIDRGANIHATTSVGPLLEFAKRQGHPTLVDALSLAGAKDAGPSPSVPAPKPADSIRGALARSLPPLQRADVAFLEKAGCVSCHNNSLTAMTVAAARAKGLRVDEHIARAQLQRTAAYLDENRERALENAGIPGGIDTVSYILLGMAAEQYPGDAITDAWARYVKNSQSPDGRFQCLTTRPPLESSDFQVTAASIRSLRTYGPASQRREYDAAVARAVTWLEKAAPQTTEDHAFKVLGLIWGGGPKAAIQQAARELVPLQRPDGGWGQLAPLASDAYATGQALVALRESGAVAPTSPAYQRGIQFLLNSQLEDGSWYVRTRAPAIQPYFDSDFPHGPDQFISAAATNWAAMALTTLVR